MSEAPNFKHLSNDELHQETLRSAKKEKEATLSLLHHLAEVDTRRLFATRAYSTLFEYVHRSLGYSEAQASDRIVTMRLMCRVPEVKAQLQSGKLTLTTAAKLGSHVRRENLSPDATKNLLEQVAGKSSREVERILVAQATTQDKFQRTQPISPSLTRLTFDVSEDFMHAIEEMRIFHGNPLATYEELLLRAMREFVKKRNGQVLRAPEVKDSKESASDIRTESESKTEGESGSDSRADISLASGKNQENSPKNPGSSRSHLRNTLRERSRYIPTHVRHAVQQRSGNQCEYVDPKTRQRCEGRRSLQWEHVKPFGRGGPHSIENLKHYCPAHNRLSALRTYGAQKMNEFFGKRQL